MPDASRPWIVDDRADTLEVERRPRDPHIADRFVKTVLSAWRPALIRGGIVDAIAPRYVIWRGRRLQRLDDAALVRHVRMHAQTLMERGLRGRALIEVAAGVREASGRILGLRHHPVQIAGGLALARGRIVEMATGEGKTLTSLVPAVTAALCGVPVHVMTVNDYLARRDAETLRPVIAFFGLTVGVVVEDTPHADRPGIYASDVVFTTNKHVAFDYLRDRLALARHASALAVLAHRTLASSPRDSRPTLTRGLGFAIVDEVDSILIDEAQTPLIITKSTSGSESDAVARAFLDCARLLEEGADYAVDHGRRRIVLKPSAEAMIAGFAPPGPEFIPLEARRERVEQALSAIHLYRRDEHYVVRDGKVAIVDEFTGRVMPDRQWQRGLHQIVEAKERVDTSGARETIAQITYQTFFTRYLWFCGMTGTAREVARELRLVHSRPVLALPTHRRSKRRRRPTRIYGSSDRRWKAVAREALRVAGRGRAVLIGTRSVEASETIAAVLRADSRLDPARLAVLNATQDADEAAVVAAAGQEGRITIATNMAGRGTDIPVPPHVEARGGLHVILTEFHSSSRIDRQLYGRAGRQGQRGSAVAIVSLEDRLFGDHARIATALARALTLGWGGPLPRNLAEWLRIIAQNRAERMGRSVRKRTTEAARRLARQLAFRPDRI